MSDPTGPYTVASLVVVPSVPKADDNKRDYVVFHSIGCKEGDFQTPLYEGDEGQAAVYNMQDEHYRQTDHTGYWHYKIERSQGRIVHPAKGHW